MNEYEFSGTNAAFGVLTDAVKAASSRVQDAGVQAFDVVEPDQAHSEADRHADLILREDYEW